MSDESLNFDARLDQALETYELIVRSIAFDAFERILSPLLKQNSINFVTGQGDYFMKAEFSDDWFSSEECPENFDLPPEVFDVLNMKTYSSVNSRHKCKLGSLMPDVCTEKEAIDFMMSYL